MDVPPSASVNNIEIAAVEVANSSLASSNESGSTTSGSDTFLNVSSEELVLNTENVGVNEPQCQNLSENIDNAESYADNINVHDIDLVIMNQTAIDKSTTEISKQECSTSSTSHMCDNDDNVEDLWLESGTSGLVKVDEDFEVIVKSLETAIVETERYDIDTVLSSNKEPIISTTLISEAEKVIDTLEEAIIESACDTDQTISSDSLLNDLSKELVPSPLITPSLSEIVEQGEKVMLSDNIEIGDDITKELEAETSKLQSEMSCMQDQCLENLIEPTINDFSGISDDIQECEVYDEQTSSLFDPADSVTELPDNFVNQPSILEIQEATMMCDISEEINRNIENPESPEIENSTANNIIDTTENVMETLNEELAVEDLKEDFERKLLASPKKLTLEISAEMSEKELSTGTSTFFEDVNVESEIQKQLLSDELNSADNVSEEQILEITESIIFKFDNQDTSMKDTSLENDNQEIETPSLNIESNIDSENMTLEDTDVTSNLVIETETDNENKELNLEPTNLELEEIKAENSCIIEQEGDNADEEIPAFNKELKLDCEKKIVDATVKGVSVIENKIDFDETEVSVDEELNLECTNTECEEDIVNNYLIQESEVEIKAEETSFNKVSNIDDKNKMQDITENDLIEDKIDGDNNETLINNTLNLKCINIQSEEITVDNEDKETSVNKTLSLECENIESKETTTINEEKNVFDSDDKSCTSVNNESNLKCENIEINELENEFIIDSSNNISQIELSLQENFQNSLGESDLHKEIEDVFLSGNEYVEHTNEDKEEMNKPSLNTEDVNQKYFDENIAEVVVENNENVAEVDDENNENVAEVDNENNENVTEIERVGKNENKGYLDENQVLNEPLTDMEEYATENRNKENKEEARKQLTEAEKYILENKNEDCLDQNEQVVNKAIIEIEESVGENKNEEKSDQNEEINKPLTEKEENLSENKNTEYLDENIEISKQPEEYTNKNEHKECSDELRVEINKSSIEVEHCVSENLNEKYLDEQKEGIDKATTEIEEYISEHEDKELSNKIKEEINMSLLEMEEYLCETINDEQFHVNKEINSLLDEPTSPVHSDVLVEPDKLTETNDILHVLKSENIENVVQSSAIDKSPSTDCSYGQEIINNTVVEKEDIGKENIGGSVEILEKEKVIGQKCNMTEESVSLVSEVPNTQEHEFHASVDTLTESTTSTAVDKDSNKIEEIIVKSAEVNIELESKDLNIKVNSPQPKIISEHTEIIVKEDERTTAENTKKHTLPLNVKLQSPPKKIKLIRQKEHKILDTPNIPELPKDKDEVCCTGVNKLDINISEEREIVPKDLSPPKVNTKQKLKLKRTYKRPDIAEKPSTQKIEILDAKSSEIQTNKIETEKEINAMDLLFSSDKKEEIIISPLNQEKLEQKEVEIIKDSEEIVKKIEMSIEKCQGQDQEWKRDISDEIENKEIVLPTSPKSETQISDKSAICSVVKEIENNLNNTNNRMEIKIYKNPAEENLNLNSLNDEDKSTENNQNNEILISGRKTTECGNKEESDFKNDKCEKNNDYDTKNEIENAIEEFPQELKISGKNDLEIKQISCDSSVTEKQLFSTEMKRKEERKIEENVLENNDEEKIHDVIDDRLLDEIIDNDSTIINFESESAIVPLENEIRISDVRSLVSDESLKPILSENITPQSSTLKINEDLTIEPIQKTDEIKTRSLKRKLEHNNESLHVKSLIITKPLSVEIDDYENTVEKETENYPKIIIKPIPKPEERCSPKITIKPIKPPDTVETSKGHKSFKISSDDSCTPKITIKPVLKPPDPLKITITKQRNDDTHSILKIYKPDEDSSLTDTIIPKLTIKPINKTDDIQHSPRVTIKPVKAPGHQQTSISSISPKITVKPILPPNEQQIEITHLPKVTVKPIVSPEESYPKVTIKPILRPDDTQKLQQLSPRQIKVKSMTFESTSGVTVEPISMTPPGTNTQKSENDGLLSPLKISVKPFAKIEEPISPKLTIKPITKTCEIVQTEDGSANPLKLTIKPLLKPEESYQSPKITIKPIIKPEDTEITVEDSDKPERIILKIQKTSLSSPKERSSHHVKEQKKEPEIRIEAIPHDPDKNQKLDKIKLKLTKEGNHAQIIPSSSTFNIEQQFHLKRALTMSDHGLLEKRARTELSGTEIIHTSDISINLVEPNAKPNPKVISEEVTIMKIDKPTISGRKSSAEQISQLKFKEMLLKIQQKSDITCTQVEQNDDSSSSDDVKIIGVIQNDPPTDPLSLNDESSSQDVMIVNEIINTNPFHDVQIIPAPPICDPSIPINVPKKRGRPRKNPLQVKPEIKGEDCVEIIRPKRTCRAPAGRPPYIIKERKPRGAGRGRGRGRGAAKAVQKIPKEPKSLRGKALREAKALAKLEAARLAKEIVIDEITIEDSTNDTPVATPVPPVEEQVKKPSEIKVPEVQMSEPVVKITQINEALLKQPPPPVAVYEEETRMSADNNNSRSQTPARQVVIPPTPEGPEESQSSVQSTATTESNKNKKGRLEVCDPDSAVTVVDQIAEYSWGGGGPYMLQEQIAQYLGVKSFKRKYPGLTRRPVEMQERDYIREKALVSESMCDMGLTAVPSSEILDIMYTDFQDKYEEYRKFMRDKQSKEISNKQKAISLATSQEKNKIDFKERAVRSAANWNINFNKARKESRRCCMDLQTFTINYPVGRTKDKVPVKNPVGHYPIALVPGQFTDYYKSYTSNDLHYLPLNTVRYGPVLPNQQQWDDGGQSDASQSDSDSSSGSDSDSSDDSMSTTEDQPPATQQLCKPTTVTLSPLVVPAKTKVH